MSNFEMFDALKLRLSMKKADEKNLLSMTNSIGFKELEKFKSRARLRHETINGRLKCFGSLSAQRSDMASTSTSLYLKPLL